jgi:hypothetical protein
VENKPVEDFEDQYTYNDDYISDDDEFNDNSNEMKNFQYDKINND